MSLRALRSSFGRAKVPKERIFAAAKAAPESPREVPFKNHLSACFITSFSRLCEVMVCLFVLSIKPGWVRFVKETCSTRVF